MLGLSEKMFQQAKKLIPGGVNSPVRAYSLVAENPPFISRGAGAYLYDEDGRSYIDYVNSWGATILGHAHQKVTADIIHRVKQGVSFGAPTLGESQLAEKIIAHMPTLEMVRFVNSGTEACMSAVRLARGYTQKKMVVKFDGHYHGHCDALLAGAGSGVATESLAASEGVTLGSVADTLVLPFNNTAALQEVFERYGRDHLSCVIFEIIAGNCGFIRPQPEFLSLLQDLCQRYQVLLVADEVMTGFRVHVGGAQSLYHLTPDLTVLGKVIGGGMPLACYGGRRDIMKIVSPLGGVYQAGTLSGNPVAVQCGLTTLDLLCDRSQYSYLSHLSSTLTTGLKKQAERLQVPLVCDGEGGMFGYTFTTHPLESKKDVDQANMKYFKIFFSEMLKCGIYLPPSPYESCFLSTAHTDDDIQQTLRASQQALSQVAEFHNTSEE
ncbi:MAG: glutamate-1-semialdehyde 2,1-aminomutase [Proteobacteria bacterium]|nr:glutamate-1-semialdehyde 2,1-aminomutase [Pseudomonadota bacterium]